MTAPATVGIPVARPKRRGTELWLLVLAMLTAAGARAAVQLGVDEKITVSVLGYTLALTALFGIAHLAVRRWAPYADPVLLPLVAALLAVGTAMIYRLDLATTDHSPADAPLQLVWIAIGVALFVALLKFLPDHRVLARYGYTAGLSGIVLLLLPSLLPASMSEVNGAKVWIRFAGFSFQPSELAKLLLMVFFASYLVAKRPVLSVVTRSIGPLELPRARDLGPVLIAWIASMLVLVRERDLGSALLFFGIFVVMLYIATERASWLLIGLALFAGGAFLAYHAFGHVQDRVNIWLHAFAGNNPTDASYQLVQGLFGFATGGVLGTGLGRGEPQTVPFARTDFIFASIGEELGLVGVTAILVIYLVLVARGLRAAIGVRDSFGKLLAGGLAASLALQTFVVVGGVMRLIPLTGLTLPFVSYGGSSILANFVLIALLIRISDAGRRPAHWPTPEGVNR
ncbi:MAG TPA: FtsW/RodA/SpoVE family cell cycle protein [Mycobacteriales bacterium]|jgi:cell division protein FtsW (lipid II flippase)|nr:FtsW/RodA/SpoVE family cell cycle protein [Mycobacteriales bacterium]